MTGERLSFKYIIGGYKNMEELKSLFGESSLNYEEFSKKLGEISSDSFTLANVKSGDYVSRTKYADIEKKMSKLQEKYNALSENTQGYDDLQTKYDTLKTDYDALITKQDEADKMAMVSNSNVDPDFVEFVYTKVQKLTNESKDFKTALGEYLKENKQYLKTPKGTYVDLEKGTIQKSPNEKMNDFIRRKLK